MPNANQRLLALLNCIASCDASWVDSQQLSNQGSHENTPENTSGRKLLTGQDLLKNIVSDIENEALINSIDTITLDSRAANKTSIFVALFGKQVNGHQYIESAVSNGCPLVVVETSDPHQHLLISHAALGNYKFVKLHVFLLNKHLSELASAFYPLDSDMSISAVTGTNGKTSVASIYAQLNSLLGKPAGSIGTLGVQTYNKGINNTVSETINTTPDVLSLFKSLYQLSNQGIDHVCVEASSHGLVQKRLNGVPVNTAIFTNLSQDHLDYHQNMQAYADAKRLLLEAKGLSKIVLNADDKEALIWAQQASNSIQIFWYSLTQPAFFDKKNIRGCWVSEVKYTSKGSEFILHSTWGARQVVLSLIGHFNVANVLASVTALLAEGEDFDQICAVIEKISGVAGRMELFVNKKASILVDYAHTPDALKQTLNAARLHTLGKLTCIFGCGGDRDKTKRPLMGEIAHKLADNSVITQDNSRSENINDIISDILSGMNASLENLPSNVSIEIERETAIKLAWQQSTRQDMIVVAGKGHESYMEVGGQIIDYDERAFVKTLVCQLSDQTEHGVTP